MLTITRNSTLQARAPQQQFTRLTRSSATSNKSEPITFKFSEYMDKLHAARVRAPVERDRVKRLLEVVDMLKSLTADEIKLLKAELKTDHVDSVAKDPYGFNQYETL